MNKGDLIEIVAKKTGMTKKDAAEAVNLTLTTIQANVKKGVLLVGFGSFSVTRRKARLGRNPQTGESIKIKARNVVRFKAGKSWKV